MMERGVMVGTKSITLTLPSELYERIKEEAEARNMTMEALIIETLENAFGYSKKTGDAAES